jgi:DNA-binding GntR family transcriptional regulator
VGQNNDLSRGVTLLKSQSKLEFPPRRSATAPAASTHVLDRITNETLQKRVYDQLRAAFLESRFLPGETLTLRALAEMTGTSVQPVREALQRLCAEGALEWHPNTAFRVPEIDPARYHELWSIRQLLEGEATRVAAGRIRPTELAELKDINRDMRASMRRGDPEATLRLNREFHFAIYKAADSPRLVALIEMIWMQVSPLFAAFTRHELGLPRSGLTDRLPAAAEDFFGLQDAVIEALSSHAPDRATAAVHKVLELSAHLFMQTEATQPEPVRQRRKRRTS